MAPGVLTDGDPGSGPITQELANNTLGNINNGRMCIGIWWSMGGRSLGGASIPFVITSVN